MFNYKLLFVERTRKMKTMTEIVYENRPEMTEMMELADKQVNRAIVFSRS